MKKLVKKIVLTIILISMIMFNSRALALSDLKDEADKFIDSGSASAPITTNDAWEILRPIAQILVGIASVVLVIAYMYLGIQYMITDPSGKANIKQKLIGLVIATVLIYGGIGIFTIIINLFNSIFG